MDNYDIAIVIGIKLCTGKYADCIQNVVYKFSKFFNTEDFDFIMNLRLDNSNMPYDEVLDEKLHEFSENFVVKKGRYYLTENGTNMYIKISENISNLKDFLNEVIKNE